MILAVLNVQFSSIKYIHTVVQKKKKRIYIKRNSVIQSYLVKAKKKTQKWDRKDKRARTN